VFAYHADIVKRTFTKQINAMKKFALLFVISIAALLLLQAKKTPAERDPRWAQPITIAGVPNLHKISDGLYRGAQPTAEGIRELKKMGIRTIVSLRPDNSDKNLLGDTGLAYEEIPCRAWHFENKNVVKFLKIVTDPSRQPVFFHCVHGSDRTGAMSAVYRVGVQNWTKEDAIKEMRAGGYGFHSIWMNLVGYIKNLDVSAIKKAILTAP
jgi:protein tyrosine/serine phosphatase